MITAVVTVPEAGWKVRIRRKHDLKEEEEEEEEKKKPFIWPNLAPNIFNQFQN